ncbi:MAG: transposase, partial [Terriglobia bacterium]|nr:transposase [Terriglobia bacterium]
AEKRRIVEQTLSSSMSVASLARQHGVNANQVFYWRKLYRAGQLGGEVGAESSSVRLLRVRVDSDEGADPEPGATAEQSEFATPTITMNIEIPGRALVSLEGSVDAGMIRAVLESLRG